MSTLLHDVSSHAAFAVALSPRVLVEDATGPPVELPDADGPVFAAVQVGAVEVGTGVAVAFEQSSGNGSWSEAATLPTATAANAVVAGTFPCTARYLRCVVTITGPDPLAEVAVLVGQQKKVV